MAPRHAFALCSVVVLLLVFRLQPATSKKHKSLLVNNADPSDESAFERGLVTEHIHYRSLLMDHSRHWEKTSHRHFNGTVLAYVTPWNAKGYDVALKFAAKFTHVSPVWYQLKSEAGGPVLTGGDSANLNWLQKMRESNPSTKVVPRVVVEGAKLHEMLVNEAAMTDAIDLVVQECKARGYDGVVLEAWSSWRAAGILGAPAIREKALSFIQYLAQALQATSSRLETILVISPPGAGGQVADVFSPLDMSNLAPYVSAFSLMTYDYSNAYHPGPNAPLHWIRTCLMYFLPHLKPKHIEAFQDEAHYSRELRSVEDEEGEGDEMASKVLLGLNFYGNKFLKPQGGGPIVGHEYLEFVDKHRPSIKWDDGAKEHYFKVVTKTGAHYEVFYPSLQSIATRLDEARAWGTGVAIWEIGQGLDFFYDLL